MTIDTPVRRKLAVVLFNLGGPDGPADVRPFLRNLFSDPAIIGLPAPIRLPLAALISGLRAKSARANYAIMGGGSPLLGETRKQAAALSEALEAARPDLETRVFIAMRYWSPTVAQAARDVAAFAPDDIVHLPLYPQFSTTTTQSSTKAWRAVYRGPGALREVCCYPTLPDLIEAHARTIAETAAGLEGPYRLLFSAHGLPEKIVSAGDPYQRQIEATAAAVAARLPGVDWQICYQSRVGPMKWLGPSTPQAITAAAEEGLSVVVSPIAFVSEHIETLVELDHEYADLARELGCPEYARAPALGVDPGFIGGLTKLVTGALGRAGGAAPGEGWTCEACGPICPAKGAP